MISKHNLKIVFMGTPDFAVPSLEKLQQSTHSIEAVVTVPDKPQGRGQKLRSSPVKLCAHNLGLKVLQPESLKDPDFIHELQNIAPDLIVVVAFQILPKEVYTIPTFGSFNLHASLLPKYRGAAPIHWALLNGDSESGVSTFFLKAKVDTGNIIAQRKTAIDPEDNLQTLYEKLRLLGADLVLHTVDIIAADSITEMAQDDSLATPAPKVSSETQVLHFEEDCHQCHNRIRAFAPKPGAHTLRNGSRIKFLSTKVSELSGEPGHVIAVSTSSFTIACAQGSLEVTQVQPEGKKSMDVSSYLLGNPIQLGDHFG